MKKILLTLVAVLPPFLASADNSKHIGDSKLYYGASYYAEAWPEDCIDLDIQRMKELNMNVVRMAEFAWSKMEPREGEYDFSWLHKIIDRLHSEGIDVILGTPTATPPAWLGIKYPDIYRTDENGKQMIHGERRSCSYTNKHYLDYCAKIVEQMAREFGDKPGVIGWQIDNELALTPDYSDETRQQWIDWLRQRYGSIENLNEKWCLTLWSQEYPDFENVPLPLPVVWNNPSLVYAWREFTNEAVLDFNKMQCDIIRKYSKAPITHDTTPGNLVDFERMFEDLDYTAVNNYHSFEAYDLIQSNYDRLRGIDKGMPWLFETAPNNSGGGDNGSTWYLHQIPGSLNAALWMCYASGGQGIMFWPWRQQRSGHEVVHGACVSAWNKPCANWSELKDMGQKLSNVSDVFMDNPVTKPKVAIVYSHLNQNGLSLEKYANGLRYYQDWSYRFYRPMADAYIFRDVIYPNADISDYKLLFVPLLPYMSDDFRERLQKWVERGGTLIAGPMTAYRTEEWNCFTDAMMGMFEKWAGIEGDSFIPVGTERRPAEMAFPLSFAPEYGIDGAEAGLWSIALSSKTGADTIAVYTAGHHAGKPAIMESRIGKGKLVVLGTDPGKDAVKSIVMKYAAQQGIEPDAEGDPGVVVVPRKGKKQGLVAVNITPLQKSLKLKSLKGSVTDLLTGENVDLSSEITFDPYEVKILFK